MEVLVLLSRVKKERRTGISVDNVNTYIKR
jgi:hypothetical protein